MLNGVMDEGDVWEREEGRWRLRVGWKGEGKSVRRESKPAIKRRVRFSLRVSMLHVDEVFSLTTNCDIKGEGWQSS